MGALRVLHVGAELHPLLKTGGLADVLAALPRALAVRGHEVRLLLPGHPALLEGLAGARSVLELGPMFGAGRCTLLAGHLRRLGARPRLARGAGLCLAGRPPGTPAARTRLGIHDP